MPVRPIIAIAVIALLTAACGETDEPQSATTTAPAGEPVLREVDVDGALVRTFSAPTELPDRASLVEFTTTVIDSGDGPELCLGNVLDSLPPQCGGPVADGLDMAGWSQSQAGVTWGDRTVVVEWPPVDGRLVLVEDRPAGRRIWPDDRPPSLPAECADLGPLVDVEVLQRWALANPDRAGVISVADDQRSGVLRVTGDPADVRAELSTDEATACVVGVEFSQTDLESAQGAVNELFDTDAFLLSTGSGNIHNRLSVGVAVADLDTVRAVIDRVEDPGILRIEGVGVILE